MLSLVKYISHIKICCLIAVALFFSLLLSLAIPASKAARTDMQALLVPTIILILVVIIIWLIVNINRSNKIETSLRESEDLYRSVVDNIGIGVSLISPEMKILSLNKQMRVWFPDIDDSGHPNCYKSFNDPPGREICSYCPTCLTLRDGQIHSAMTETPAKDRIINFKVVSSPITDLNGVIIAAVELVEDITERKKTDRDLIKSEAKYRALFAKMTNAFALHRIILDDDGQAVDYVFLEANAAFEKLTGLAINNIINKRVTEVMTGMESKIAVWIKTYGEVALSGKEVRFEAWSDIPGKWYSVSAYSPITNYFVTIFEDITEKKMMEESVRESEEKYRALFEDSKDVVFISSQAGRFLDINTAGVELFGYSSKKELLNIDLNKDLYISPADRMKYQAMLNDGGFVKDYEVDMKKKSGERLTVLISSSCFRNTKDNMIVYRGIIRDISEHKKLEQQLFHAQKMEAVGQLAGGVAHDFNNILTAIMGFSSLLQMKTKEDLTKDYTERILELSERATNLTQSLLAFSRKQLINPRPANINEIVGTIGELLMRIIGEDIELKSTLSPQGMVVFVDRGQIEHVLMNLAANARDAMPDGGTLTISTTSIVLDGKFIETHGFGDIGNYSMISVMDTGVGMNGLTRARIFEPFFTTKEVGKGTGLGLAMVYGIIKQHNGFINVYSEVGEGTIFRIYLPILQIKAEEKTTEQTWTMEGGAETILLAEDSAEVRKTTKALLEEFGYKVIEAVDGEEAVIRLMEHEDSVDLLITDVIMPKKNGRETYREVKVIQPDIKVLFTSGYTVKTAKERGLVEDGLEMISKPISCRELLQKIRQILDE
jgi:PAS domain S-box-containing protein